MVIPGRAERREPGIHNHLTIDVAQAVPIAALASMDSGLAAARCPGMTQRV